MTIPDPVPLDPSPHSGGAARSRRIAPICVLVTVLAATGALDWRLLLPVISAFLLVVPCERLFPRHEQDIVRPGLVTDAAWSGVHLVIRLTGVGAALLAVEGVSWLPHADLASRLDGLPEPFRLAAGVVAFDFLYYWGHRFNHEVPALWAIHSVHHSSTHLDWLSGARNHPLDSVAIFPGIVGLHILGFTGKFVGALAAAHLVILFFKHANVSWRLRPLHKIVVTPEFHHWHHCREEEAINKNYGALLPVWDLIFGTYYMPDDGRRPRNYGTTTAVPQQFGTQVLWPFRAWLMSPEPPVRRAAFHGFRRRLRGRPVRRLGPSPARLRPREQRWRRPSGSSAGRKPALARAGRRNRGRRTAAGCLRWHGNGHHRLPARSARRSDRDAGG